MGNQESLKKGDCLLLEDVQNDFCPGGALPVEDGDKVVPVLNQWIDVAQKKGIPIYAARDWHPVGHVSFAQEGGEWSPHCVQDTEGAAFHPDLKLPENVIKITKGVRFDQDQLSSFDQTGLADQLHRDGVKRLWVGGLALDVCVRATVLDAIKAGFQVNVLLKATRPITPEGGKGAIAEMKQAGAKIVETDPA